jgi:hypothetical protein
LLELEGHGVVELSDHVGQILPLGLAFGLELKVETVLADRPGTFTRPLMDVIWLQIEKAVPVAFLKALVKVLRGPQEGDDRLMLEYPIFLINLLILVEVGVGINYLDFKASFEAIEEASLFLIELSLDGFHLFLMFSVVEHESSPVPAPTGSRKLYFVLPPVLLLDMKHAECAQSLHALARPDHLPVVGGSPILIFCLSGLVKAVRVF